jgi:hypothetical protein
MLVRHPTHIVSRKSGRIPVAWPENAPDDRGRRQHTRAGLAHPRN